jgi:phospholipase C
MTMIRQSRRRFLQAGTAAGAALFTPNLIRPALAQGQPAAPDLGGLRDKIEHIVVIFQENRAFDHYFGAYQPPGSGPIANLLDEEGHVDPRFTGWQKNPAGAAYPYLPAPYTVPGFAGAQLPNRPFPLAPFIPATTNVPWDPMHHFFRMFAQVNGGKMDRFVALALGGRHEFFDKPPTDPAAMLMAESTASGAVLGFYTRDDLPGYHHLADEYVLCDNFFQAMSGGSTGNALYLVSARSAVSSKAPAAKIGSLEPPVFDRPYDKYGILINDLAPVNGPTETFMGSLDLSPPPEEQTYPNIGQRLDGASLSWAWYNEAWNRVKPWAMKNAFGAGDGSVVVDTPWAYLSHHNPFQYYPSWFDNVQAGHIRDAEDDFFEDAKTGNLPNVSFVKATGARDEHPANSAPRWGEDWVMSLLKAVASGPLWSKTAIVVAYDEGGGFWDHVAPPTPDPYGCGTRVPCMLIGPWSRRGYIDHKVADTTSILALIEARFGLQPMQTRDASAYNLLDGLDFTQKPRDPAFG